jgi:FtsH-binding integral membrane protein
VILYTSFEKASNNPGRRRDMKLRTLMVINTILAAVFGIGFVLAPGQVASLYGNDPTPILNFTAQLFGGTLIAFAVLTWSARNDTDSDSRRAIIFALLVGTVIGFIVSLIAQLGRVVNALGWSTVAIYLFLAIGFGYFHFAKPAH